MEKVKNRCKKYELSVTDTNNGYFQARVSVKLGCEKTNRLQKGGKSTEQAVNNLLTELYQYIDQMYKDDIITKRIDDIVVQRLSTSINDLCISTSETIQKTYDVINLINNINQSFNNVIPFYAPPNNILQPTVQQPIQAYIKSETVVDNNQPEKEDIKYMIEDVATKWRRYEIQQTSETEYNQRLLKRKTIDGYIRIMNKTILPALKKRKLLYINQVKEDVINDLIKNANGFDGKRNIDITLRLFFRFLVKENIVIYDPMENISKPVRPKKNKEKKIKYIEPENQYKYLDMFEEENTEMSMLFETLLEAGCRPEERMSDCVGKNYL